MKEHLQMPNVADCDPKITKINGSLIAFLFVRSVALYNTALLTANTRFCCTFSRSVSRWAIWCAVDQRLGSCPSFGSVRGRTQTFYNLEIIYFIAT